MAPEAALHCGLYRVKGDCGFGYLFFPQEMTNVLPLLV